LSNTQRMTPEEKRSFREVGGTRCRATKATKSENSVEPGEGRYCKKAEKKWPKSLERKGRGGKGRTGNMVFPPRRAEKTK